MDGKTICFGVFYLVDSLNLFGLFWFYLVFLSLQFVKLFGFCCKRNLGLSCFLGNVLAPSEPPILSFLELNACKGWEESRVSLGRT